VTVIDNKELARDIFVRLGRSDIPGAVALLSNDVTWSLPGKTDQHPAAGNYSKKEITDLFERMISRTTDGLDFTFKSILAEDDTVALQMESRGELTNGRVYNNEYALLLRFADGKVVQVREYNDTLHSYAVWYQRDGRR
jgi:ketosteroid isomerase-like protein